MEQRTCFHCIDSVEDELHFLIDCPFYDDMRLKMFHKSQLCNSDFILYDSTSTDSCQYAVNSGFNTIWYVSEKEKN